MLLEFSLQNHPPEVLYKKGALKNFSKIHRPKVCNFIKKEVLAQVFSCEF